MKKKTTSYNFLKFKKRWFNKYLFTIVIFLGWILFFDKYNFFAQLRLDNSTEKLEQEYADILEDIKQAKSEKKDLELNQEKYGREKYYLHKDDEDVFIIEKRQN